MAFQVQTLNSFIGGGITLPLKIVKGKPPIEGGFDLIRSSLIMILSWNYGDRFFLNEFGSNLQNLLEEPNDNVLKNLITTFVIEAVTVWEPRVELIEVSMVREEGKIDLGLNYRILNTQQEDTFIFPFYRQIIY